MPPAVYGPTEPWNGGQAGDTANAWRPDPRRARHNGTRPANARAAARGERAGADAMPPEGKTRTVSLARSRDTMPRKAERRSARSSDTNRKRRLARRIARRNG